MSTALKKIAIVGGDEHAWSVAARLLVGLQADGIQITVIDSDAGRLPGVLSLDSSAHQFHRQIGIAEPTLVANAGASYRFGSRFRNQSGERIFTYSPVGEMINRVHFHQYVARLKNFGGETEFLSHSLAGMAATEGRFTHPQANSPLEKLDYAINVDRLRYIHVLRKAVLEHSVQHLQSEIKNTELTADGDIEVLQLDDGQKIEMDFVIDCTGGLRRSDYESWQPYFAYDRRLSWVQESTVDTPVLTLSELGEHWWLNQTALPGGRYYQLSFASDSLDQQQSVEWAKQRVGAFVPQLSEFSDESPGIVTEPWKHNVLSVGKAAGYAGNQLFNELFHTHNALERWLALYPRRGANSLAAKEYNAATRSEYEHVRDVHTLLLRGAAVNRDLPDTLLHRMALFKGTGRVAFYESDVLHAQQWVNLFIACGIWPAKTDPLINSLSKAELTELLTMHAEQTVALAKKMPKHDQLLLAIRNAA